MCNIAKIYKFFGTVLIGAALVFFSAMAAAQQPPLQSPEQTAASVALTPPVMPNNAAPAAATVAPLPAALQTPQAPSLSAQASAPPPALAVPPQAAPSEQYVPMSPPSAASLTAPESDPAVVDAARNQAFDQLTVNTLPMTPVQIQKLRNLFADSNRAATAAPGGIPPKPVSSTQVVSLDPGATPPIIRLAQGYVTSLVFLDSTGAAWPIQSYDIGNPTAFNVQWDRTSNILMIQSQALYTTGNLVVQLKGLNTPVSISLIPGQPIVDYRVDMRIQGAGPNAKFSMGNALPEAASNDLLNVLDGVPPAKSKPLSIPGSTSQAWLVGDKNDKMYLRTHLTLLSPSWIASMSSADGTNAYQLQKVPSILVADSDGKIFNLRIEGY